MKQQWNNNPRMTGTPPRIAGAGEQRPLPPHTASDAAAFTQTPPCGEEARP